MSYKETSSVSDFFPLDTLRLITGCIELRLKFVEVFAQRRAVPVLGPRVVVVSEVAASAAAGFQPVDECLPWPLWRYWAIRQFVHAQPICRCHSPVEKSKPRLVSRLANLCQARQRDSVGA